MYTGIPPRGAEEAWMDTAIYLEEHLLEGTPVSLGAIDIYKCLDQLVRPLIYALAGKAAMPAHMLDAYKRYIENLMAYNTI